MRDDTNNPTDFDSGEAPEALISDLKRLYQDDLRIPEAVDRAILDSLHEAPAPIPWRSAKRIWWTTGITAAAAGLTLIVWLQGQPTPQAPPPPNTADQLASGDMRQRSAFQALDAPSMLAESDAMVASVKEDVDGDGQVNILDAFLVARAVESGESLDPAWDMTGDGSVSMTDVDLIANAAVSLSRRSLQ